MHVQCNRKPNLDRKKENSTPVGVWLLWLMPRQHVARGSSYCWAGIFSVF